MPPFRPLRERFEEKVDRSAGPLECWPWLGSRRAKGYGDIWDGQRVQVASRVALELDGRPAPTPDSEACHSCDNPPCVNPAHLSWGTRSETQQQSHRRGRNGAVTKPERLARGDRSPSRLHPENRPRGEGHPLVTTTDDQVAAAVALVAAGASRTLVARAMGLSLSTVSLWCLGKRRIA